MLNDRHGTDNAITSNVHLITKHLEDSESYAYLLFILVQHFVTNWFNSFFAHHTQQVRIKGPLFQLLINELHGWQLSTSVDHGTLSFQRLAPALGNKFAFPSEPLLLLQSA